MSILDGIDLDAIETLAKRATVGPWVNGITAFLSPPESNGIQPGDLIHAVASAYGDNNLHATTGFASDEQSGIDAAYIAAVNPDVMLKIIKLLREQLSITRT